MIASLFSVVLIVVFHIFIVYFVFILVTLQQLPGVRIKTFRTLFSYFSHQYFTRLHEYLKLPPPHQRTQMSEDSHTPIMLDTKGRRNV